MHGDLRFYLMEEEVGSNKNVFFALTIKGTANISGFPYLLPSSHQPLNKLVYNQLYSSC